MDIYEETLRLLEEATRLMERSGDTLVAAYIATPISLIEGILIDTHRAETA